MLSGCKKFQITFNHLNEDVRRITSTRYIQLKPKPNVCSLIEICNYFGQRIIFKGEKKSFNLEKLVYTRCRFDTGDNNKFIIH